MIRYGNRLIPIDYQNTCGPKGKFAFTQTLFMSGEGFVESFVLSRAQKKIRSKTVKRDWLIEAKITEICPVQSCAGVFQETRKQ